MFDYAWILTREVASRIPLVSYLTGSMLGLPNTQLFKLRE
jgi:hypothetical protein